MATDIPEGGRLLIRDVWADNLEAEFRLIREVVDDFPYLAMDTEFPGVVVRPVGVFKSSAEYHYQTLRANVDMLKLIQLGLAFCDEAGRLPELRPGSGEFCVWQFNFGEFSVADDLYAADSIDLLRASGIDFDALAARGVDSFRFAELLMSSGVVLNDSVSWITFHSGYDFGYLLKLLTRSALPPGEAGFFELLRTFFPTVYDIKYLMKFCDTPMHGGLNRLADALDVRRVGPAHQAGSDSLVTAVAFRKLRAAFLRGDASRYAGVLYGLGTDGAAADTTAAS